MSEQTSAEASDTVTTKTQGSLTIVGAGMKVASDISVEALALIKQADVVFYLLAGPASDDWIRGLQPEAQSLASSYNTSRPRLQAYQEMIERMLRPVREGAKVCAVFYGHPGVFVLPSHLAIRRARAEGLRAKMLAGISAEDALFADIGIDPAVHGCQSFEATDFFLRRRVFDPRSVLVLWQIGMFGELRPKAEKYRSGLDLLTEYLLPFYAPEHPVLLYRAAQHVIMSPAIRQVPLSALPTTPVSPVSTLCILPHTQAAIDPAQLALLGLDPQELNLPSS